ncbi:MAG TPA: hypothetical protein VFN17_00705 [Nitrosarchaeum sp.]|nr:hypothetical protein [Nitrosarchaeum sp.]
METKKSESITFRIDEKYDEMLRKIADERKISLNTLANQIFGNYVELEIYLQKFGIMKLSTDSFRRILSVLDDKDIVEIATRAGSLEAKEFILFKWKELNLQNVTDFIKIFFDTCGFGRCDLEIKPSKVSLSAHHDLKQKGSLYIKHFLESLIMTSLNKSCKTTITEDSVTIEFQS